MMGFRVIIPARHASTRLPGKPLREIAGRAMLQHVYACAQRSAAGQVIIATDDDRIREAATGFGATVCMTSAEHRSGTERLAEVVETLAIPEDDVIVNLQGDEPLMPVSCLNQVAEALAEHPGAVVSTLCAPLTDPDELFDPHIVKVVRDQAGYALYFSRAPIPWHRAEFDRNRTRLPADGTVFLRHIGLYAYRAGYLKEYTRMEHCDLEQAESLEQLRVLWHGGRIIVPEATEIPGPGVDTEADLEKVAALLTD
ncbi:MAG: 3-deoxy-manno-octulosonate cytidylyltransferase [Proteobacteria bacterium]|nr:3-deoxy-manno-octulosonate cytidylyltransferase [Pseudomonadota bacterium]